MPTPNYAQLVKQLVDENPVSRQGAKAILMDLDEDAVDPLIDEFYAGVSDVAGVAILNIIAEIGGPDAMSTLRNVFHFEDGRPILQRTAAQGLLHNAENLSPKEHDEVSAFVTSSQDDSL